MEKLDPSNIDVTDIVAFVNESKNETQIIIVRVKQDLPSKQIYGLEIDKLVQDYKLILNEPAAERYLFVEGDSCYFRSLSHEEAQQAHIKLRDLKVSMLESVLAILPVTDRLNNVF